MSVRWLQVAEQEATDAALWYDRQSNGLGDDFLNELDSVVERLRENAQQFSLLETDHSTREIRRCVMSRFPYLIIFECLPSETVILCVTHAHRHPNHWQPRNS